MYSFFTGICFLFIISCKQSIVGEGPMQVESRAVSGFTKIILDIPADVTVVVADSFNCVVTAQPNILKIVKTEVSGNELKISSDYSINESKISMVIALPGINGMAINGSGNIKMLNIIKSEDLKLGINGSGDMYVNAETDKLKCHINGSGSCYMRGSSKSVETKINGSGDFHGFPFLCIEGEIEINGSGDAEVAVTDVLKTSIHGSGNIEYKGSPHISSEIKGSGTIKKSE